MPANLLLIPVSIGENEVKSSSPEVVAVTRRLLYYVVENARTARRVLRALHPNLILESVQFLEIDKHDGVDRKMLQQWFKAGYEVGLMSEAGCPAVADPGAEVVRIAHEMGAFVKPLVGASSILLALMASGLGGQNFAFWGYLPIKEPARSGRIKALEQLSRKEGQTQIFIETPYRNDALFADLLKHCAPSTLVCVASGLTTEEEWVKTKSVADWKKVETVLGKMPCVFVMLA
ncbi:MAG: SAM-dependent methyltransferase [Bacteroidetes bacterium]|nr:SAM-dependent methyltransferase [Bacteroidota bacterium]